MSSSKVSGKARGRRAATLRYTAAVLCLAAPAAIYAAKSAQPDSGIGRQVAELRLKDTTGTARTLADYDKSRALVLIFMGTDCPIANGYASQVSQLSERYRERGVQFLGINANSGDTAERVARHAREYRISFPVLKDGSQVLADQLGARVTPEAFVLDEQRIVRYRGRIDDAYQSRTEKRARVASRDLEAALDAVLAGKPVPRPVTQAFGCAIQRPEKVASSKTARVTYHRDVEKIIQERCQSCHRPGQVAPFSLLTYSDAKSWAPEIKALSQSRQMPPWNAEPGHGHFADERRLTDGEIKVLAEWVDAGAPQGDPKQAPPPKQWPEGWSLGKPDLVLTAPESFSVEANGDDVFRCFVLPTGLTEEKQVVAVEVKPGNPRVVHHVLNFLDTQGRGRKLDAADPGPGYHTGPGGVGFLPNGNLGGWAPGNLPRFAPPGVGRPLPAGSDLVIQVHYHKTGKVETDQTSIGIYFAKEPVTKRLQTLATGSLAINIPPGVENHEVKANFRIASHIQVLTVTPHMHLLGKQIKATATLPDGTTKPLVYIKNWDYRWQDSFRYKEPLSLPKGTQIEVVAIYDNSSSNPRNPSNPPKKVTFGEQTTDEMCFVFFEYIQDRDAAGSGKPFRLFGPR